MPINIALHLYIIIYIFCFTHRHRRNNNSEKTVNNILLEQLKYGDGKFENRQSEMHRDICIYIYKKKKANDEQE